MKWLKRSIGYASYNRVAARDYAWKHTAPGSGYNTNNPGGNGWTGANDCGHKLNPPVKVDRSYWNDNLYSLATCLNNVNNHCHKDCACFVSQCMRAGGIPYDSGNWGYCLTNWHNTTSLKNYMKNKGYWNDGSAAGTNAGNIIYTASDHVVLCTLNDTVTRRYTGHTNDRNNQLYSTTSGFTFYNINTN